MKTYPDKLITFLEITTIYSLSIYPCVAQIVPDATLGNHNSAVTNINADHTRIDGGAIKGSNLFHSFKDFNVGEGKSVYFSNPQGIMNILSRITGGNPSQIMGKLGVSGNANLFLVNPNGILFGPNSSLDVKGSFFATTADGIKLGEEGFFSATNPESSNLLAVNPSALFLNQIPARSSYIHNYGNLKSGGDLTLASGDIKLQGELQAAGNLTLQAAHTIEIRDSTTQPFIAKTGGELKIVSEEKVDIFALHHPSSGLYSGSDMTIASGAQVIGDARYISGGNFRIQKLDGSSGGLRSPHDPVIRSNGDVSMGDYQGASLHILAGGAVTLGNVTITGRDTTSQSLQETVILSDGTSLSINGASQATLDVRAGIAGINNSAKSADITIGDVKLPSTEEGLVFLSNQYSPGGVPGNIKVGKIDTFVDFFKVSRGGSIFIDSKGQVNVTGAMNTSACGLYCIGSGGNVRIVADGNIETGSIDTSSLGPEGGNINITSRAGRIYIDNAAINTLGRTRAGDVILDGAAGITIDNSSILAYISPLFATSNNANDSSIVLKTGVNGDIIVENGSVIASLTLGTKNSPNINIGTPTFILRDSAIATATVDVNNFVPGLPAKSEGNSGDINFNVNGRVDLDKVLAKDKVNLSLSIAGQAISIDLPIGVLTLSLSEGKAGDININNNPAVSLNNGIVVGSLTIAPGKGGDVNVNSGDLIIRNSSLVAATVDGKEYGVNSGGGDAGNLTINSNNVEVTGDKPGQGINIPLSFNNNAKPIIIPFGLFAASLKSGTAGNLTINTVREGNVIFKNGVIATTLTTGDKDAGDFNISTGNLVVEDSVVATTTVSIDGKSKGAGGNMNIDASRSINVINKQENSTVKAPPIPELNRNLPVGLFSQTESSGPAGDMTIKTARLSIQGGGSVAASTSGEGQGGKLNVDAWNSIEIIGVNPGENIPSIIGSQVSDRGQGNDITIRTSSLIIKNGATISGGVYAEGKNKGGNLTVNADDIYLSGTSPNNKFWSSLLTATVSENIGGDAGNLEINTKRLTLENGGIITSATIGAGNGGKLTINATESVSVIGTAGDSLPTSIVTGTAGTGKGEDLIINTPLLTIKNGGLVSTATYGVSKGNNLIINTNGGRINIDGKVPNRSLGGILAGSGVNEDLVKIIQPYLEYFELSGTIDPKKASGDGGAVNIFTGNLLIQNGGAISTDTVGVGKAGLMNINADTINLINGGTITGNTRGSGKAGDINITSPELTLSGGANIAANTSSTGEGGSITITSPGNNLTITGGEISTTTTSEGKAGSINLEEDEINLNDTRITANTSGFGKAGDITITSPNLNLSDGANITANTDAAGEGGNITITSPTSVSISGGGKISASTSGAGAGGQIEINNPRIQMKGGVNITTSTEGAGNAGSIGLRGEEIYLDGNINANTSGFGKAGDITITSPELTLSDRANIAANTNINSTGEGGNITITSPTSVSISGGGKISASTSGAGAGGQIEINNPRIQMKGGVNITTSTEGAGNAGSIGLRGEEIYLDGNINANTSGFGKAGDITITSPELTLSDRANIAANTNINSSGEGGNITITSPTSVSISGGGKISASTSGAGAGGQIEINNPHIQMKGGVNITTSTEGAGNAGSISLRGEEIYLDGNINANTSGQGKAGDITITSPELTLSDRANIAANTNINSTGEGGNITITSPTSVSIQGGGKISASTSGAGAGGQIEINNPRIHMKGGVNITTSTEGAGNAGSISLRGEEIYLDGNINANTSGFGKAGDITITSPNLTLSDRANIAANTNINSSGEGGNITITSPTSVSISGGGKISASTSGAGAGGQIEIDNPRIHMKGGVNITTSTEGAGNAGSISLRGEEIYLDGNINANTSGFGKAGDITITSPNLTLSDRANIAANTNINSSGEGGNITITSPTSVSIQGGGKISASTSGAGAGGQIEINNPRIHMKGGVNITTSTEGAGNAGSIGLRGEEIYLDGNINANTSGQGKAGDITITSPELTLSDRANIAANTNINSTGEGGNITITSPTSVSISGGGKISASTSGAGAGGQIEINNPRIHMKGGVNITTSTDGAGNAGSIGLRGEEIYLDGNINANTSGFGKAGDITITSPELTLSDRANIAANTNINSSGEGGNITITSPTSVSISGGGKISASTSGAGAGGQIEINNPRIQMKGGVNITTSTEGAGNAGSISLRGEEIYLDGNINANTSGFGKAGDITITSPNLTLSDRANIAANTNINSTGEGGNITITSPGDNLTITGGEISVSTSAVGIGGNLTIKSQNLTLNNSRLTATSDASGNAGNISLNITNNIGVDNSKISTTSTQADGGNINISAGVITLFNNSDITTNVMAGTGTGGNINLTANSILALTDSDILSFSPEGSGGNITIDTPVFIGQNYGTSSPKSLSNTLDNNAQVDVDASGKLSSGNITIPDVSVLRNGLLQLPNQVIDTSRLLANSCVVRSRQNQGKFIITGAGNLPSRPTDLSLSHFSTGNINFIPSETGSSQSGKPILEAGGLYKLPDGRLILSRECSASDGTEL